MHMFRDVFIPYIISFIRWEEKIDIRAYIKAMHISPKEIFSELCPIGGSSVVMLRTVFSQGKRFQGVNVVLRTVTVHAGLLKLKIKIVIPIKFLSCSLGMELGCIILSPGDA